MEVLTAAWARLVCILAASGCGRVAFEDQLIGDSRTADSAPGGDTCGPLPGQVGAWPMDPGDVTGTTVIDRSGNGHTGAIVGSPAPVVTAGQLDGALDFTATTFAYVNLPTVPLDSTLGAATTVSLWVQTTDPAVDQGVFCLPAGPTPAPPRYCLWLTNRNGPISLCINGGTSECWGFEDDNLIGRWVHIVGIYRNGPTTDGALYIDGVAASMSCVFGVCDQSRVAQGPFEIGNSDSGYAWRGKLDDVQLFDRALTASEISQLYTCGR